MFDFLTDTWTYSSAEVSEFGEWVERQRSVSTSFSIVSFIIYGFIQKSAGLQWKIEAETISRGAELRVRSDLFSLPFVKHGGWYVFLRTVSMVITMIEKEATEEAEIENDACWILWDLYYWSCYSFPQSFSLSCVEASHGISEDTRQHWCVQMNVVSGPRH